MKIAAWVIIALLMVAAVLLHSIYWPQLPDKIVSQYGVNGVPEAWMSRTSFTLMVGSVQIFLPLLMTVMMGRILRSPNVIISIPRREYWMHPDRKEATLDSIHVAMTWAGIYCSSFVMCVSHLVFVANTGSGKMNFVALSGLLAALLLAIF